MRRCFFSSWHIGARATLQCPLPPSGNSTDCWTAFDWLRCCMSLCLPGGFIVTKGAAVYAECFKPPCFSHCHQSWGPFWLSELKLADSAVDSMNPAQVSALPHLPLIIQNSIGVYICSLLHNSQAWICNETSQNEQFDFRSPAKLDVYA